MIETAERIAVALEAQALAAFAETDLRCAELAAICTDAPEGVVAEVVRAHAARAQSALNRAAALLDLDALEAAR